MQRALHSISIFQRRIPKVVRWAAWTAVASCLVVLCAISRAQGSAATGAKMVDISGFIDPACAAAITDGQSHPLSSCYSTLADARRRYPESSELGQEYAQAVIQSALDSMGAAGGTIILPCGVYLANTAIRITDNKTLQGSGDCTVLKKSGNDSLLFLTGSSPILRDVLVDGSKDQGHNGIDVAVNGATGAVIRDCTIINAGSNGISIYRSTKTVVRSDRLRENGHTAILALQNVDSSSIQDNDIDIPASANEAAQGVQFRSNIAGATADRNVIGFNRITVGTRMGYCVEAAGTGGGPAKSDQVVHNQCTLTANALGGYSIADAVGTVVSSNTMDANEFNAIYTGIELVNVNQAVIEYNVLVGHGKLARGIWCSRSNIGDNIRFNLIDEIAAAGSGIDIKTTIAGETASGNRIDDNVIRFLEPSPDTKGLWLFCQPGTTCNNNEFAHNAVLNDGPSSGQGIRLDNYGTMQSNILQGNIMHNVTVCIAAKKDGATQDIGNECTLSKAASAQ